MIKILKFWLNQGNPMETEYTDNINMTLLYMTITMTGYTDHYMTLLYMTITITTYTLLT